MGTTKSATLRSVNGNVEPTYAMHQEPVVAPFICRQPAHPPNNGAGLFELSDWHIGKTIHAFVIVHHESWRVLHFGVTEHPTDEWIGQQLREATPFEEKPKYLICDNDKKYGRMFERAAKASGIEVIHTPYEAPRAHAICERFVGSLRRECLDYMLVIGVLQLNRILKGYISYFNQARPHQGIAQRIPAPRVSPLGEPKAGKVMAFPVLNGLPHDYRRAAA